MPTSRSRQRPLKKAKTMSRAGMEWTNVLNKTTRRISHAPKSQANQNAARQTRESLQEVLLVTRMSFALVAPGRDSDCAISLALARPSWDGYNVSARGQRYLTLFESSRIVVVDVRACCPIDDARLNRKAELREAPNSIARTTFSGASRSSAFRKVVGQHPRKESHLRFARLTVFPCRGRINDQRGFRLNRLTIAWNPYCCRRRPCAHGRTSANSCG